MNMSMLVLVVVDSVSKDYSHYSYYLSNYLSNMSRV
jgi:hypothetical protein